MKIDKVRFLKNGTHHLNVVKKHVYISEQAVFMFKEDLLIIQVLTRCSISSLLLHSTPGPSFQYSKLYQSVFISAWPDKRTKKRTYLAKWYLIYIYMKTNKKQVLYIYILKCTGDISPFKYLKCSTKDT